MDQDNVIRQVGGVDLAAAAVTGTGQQSEAVAEKNKRLMGIGEWRAGQVFSPLSSDSDGAEGRAS